MAMRTEKEIERQLDLVKRLRAVMPERSFFGDDNWAKLDAQALILERAKSGRWGEEELIERRDEYTEEYEENADRIDAIDWLLCETDDDLVEEGDIETFSKDKKNG